jgi:carbon-monoxide dehydrogenase medium subunit
VKPAPFAYYRAASVDDAIAALSGTDMTSRPLAGGQSLVPMLNLRLAPVDRLVDLTHVGALKQVEAREDRIAYGAMLTHAAFEDRQVEDASNGLMPFIGSQIAYRAVRTRGTIGGAIALADPSADWVTTAIALEAEIQLAGPDGRQSVPAVEFVTGPYMTTLSDNEIIEAIVVPRRPATERWGHYKAARKIGEYADSMAIALIDRRLGQARLVVGAVDGAPLVLHQSARAIVDGKSGEPLMSTIRTELVDSGRHFSPAKLHLHTTVASRAVQHADQR